MLAIAGASAATGALWAPQGRAAMHVSSVAPAVTPVVTPIAEAGVEQAVVPAVTVAMPDVVATPAAAEVVKEPVEEALPAIAVRTETIRPQAAESSALAFAAQPGAYVPPVLRDENIRTASINYDLEPVLDGQQDVRSTEVRRACRDFMRSNFSVMAISRVDGVEHVLYAHDADRQIAPASLTKTMSLLLVFDALQSGRLREDMQFTFTREARSIPAVNAAGYRARLGNTMSLRDIMRLASMRSANDAAYMLGLIVSGAQATSSRNPDAIVAAGSVAAAADMMNARALGLGMTRTVFRNSSGLPHPEQLTTASDMVTLEQTIYNQYPQYRHYRSRHEVTIGAGARTAPLRGHNNFLGERTAEGFVGVGGKTGYVNASGFNNMITLEGTVRGQLSQIFLVAMSGETFHSRDACARAIVRHASRNFLEPNGPLAMR